MSMLMIIVFWNLARIDKVVLDEHVQSTRKETGRSLLGKFLKYKRLLVAVDRVPVLSPEQIT